jgi:hypothetical protein
MPDPGAVAADLRSLAALLAEGNAAAADLLPRLTPAIGGEGPARALFEALRRQIDDFDFDDARATLSSLAESIPMERAA